MLISLVAFVLTFLGATLLNIAAGQPFTPAQVLWIHFFVSAPFGVALGLDQADARPDELDAAAAAASRS